jgi:hypothetical protein
MRIIDRLRIFFDIDYSSNKEYWIPIDEIKIKEEFLSHSPNYYKYKKKEKTFIKYGELGKIVVDRNYELIDGYCSYLICMKYDIGKVPVWFE